MTVNVHGVAMRWQYLKFRAAVLTDEPHYWCLNLEPESYFVLGLWNIKFLSLLLLGYLLGGWLSYTSNI